MLMLRKLQQGDKGGHIRHALADFPDQAVARRIWDRYYIAEGKSPLDAYDLPPMQSISFPQFLFELTIISSFVEVFLARSGHDGVVGISLLEKNKRPRCRHSWVLCWPMWITSSWGGHSSPYPGCSG